MILSRASWLPVALLGGSQVNPYFILIVVDAIIMPVAAIRHNSRFAYTVVE